jgi:hypothetical protein
VSDAAIVLSDSTDRIARDSHAVLPAADKVPHGFATRLARWGRLRSVCILLYS